MTVQYKPNLSDQANCLFYLKLGEHIGPSFSQMSTPTEWASGAEWIRRGELTRTRWRPGPVLIKDEEQRWSLDRNKVIHPKWWRQLGNWTYLVLLLFGFRFIKLLVVSFKTVLADHLEIFFTSSVLNICLVLFNRALSSKIFDARYNLQIFHTALQQRGYISGSVIAQESYHKNSSEQCGSQESKIMWDAEGRKWVSPPDSAEWGCRQVSDMKLALVSCSPPETHPLRSSSQEGLTQLTCNFTL